MCAGHAAVLGQLEDPLRARVDGPVDRMAEPRHLRAGLTKLADDLLRAAAGAVRVRQ